MSKTPANLDKPNALKHPPFMNQPSEHKKKEWQMRAAAKKAIVPHFFEVFPDKVIIECGKCKTHFQRNLIPRLNEPTFICPNTQCRSRNWVPVTFDLTR